MTALNRDVVRYRDEKDGRDLRLELSTGRVFDPSGNTVAQWTPSDNNQTELIADYVAQMSYEVMGASLESRDKGRAETVRSFLASGRDDTEFTVKMDLGVGDVHQSTPLANFSSGYRNEQPMADVVAPPFLISVPAGKFYQYAKEDAFQRGLPIVGAGGAQVPEISPRVALGNFSTTEYALGGYVSTQVQAAEDAQLRVKQATARRIFNALLIEREIRVANLFTAAAYDSTLVATIAAGSQWNGGASGDPIADIMTRQEKSYGGVTGILMSGKLYHWFIRNNNVQKYFLYKGNAPPLPTPDEVSRLFGLPPIYVANMKYINPSGVLDYIWGNNVVLFRQPDQMPPTTQDDVATAYTFRWTLSNIPDGVTNNGWTVREYFVQDRGSMGGNKIVMVHHDAEIVTSTFVGGFLANAYQ